MDKHVALRQYFGHDGFRAGQEQIIDGILAGRDALGIMPTGGGKSLCYQIPALLLPALTLVISPLISLMKDQVMALRDVGVDAAFFNSSLSERQQEAVYEKLAEGAYTLLYVAPERLESPRFLSAMGRRRPSLVAVDEAHCISQWGQDFRPSYLKITAFLEALSERPVVAAFTATATQAVQDDIAHALELRDPVRVVTGFDRPNLHFDVQKPRAKSAALQALVGERRSKSGIVYCATRAAVEKVCGDLQKMGISATRYHAGLSDGERLRNQDAFQYDESPVMVATNAFGMGIDKSNVGFVIHYNMPKSLEAYYQEAGRAGRDGEAADCILLYSAGDIVTAKFLIDRGSESAELDDGQRANLRRQDGARLDTMIGYCNTNACLRGYILDYFGQGQEGACGNCGTCNSTYTTEDITREAQMILSCVKRVRDLLGYHVGVTLLVRVLHGSREKRVLELGLDGLTTYGLLQTRSRSQIRSYIDFLEAQGYLQVNPAHSTLEWTETSAAVLFGGQQVEMEMRAAPVQFEAGATKSAAGPPGAPPSELFEALRAVRTQLAREEGVPAYIVFSNASLADMAEKRPRTPAAFLDVNGVGERKAARYGRYFLDAIAQFASGEQG